MRKPITFSLEEEIIEALEKKATRKHISRSRMVEEILRKTLRLK